MSETPPTGPVTTLPVWSTVGGTFRSVLLENIRLFPRAVFTPLVLSLVLLLLQIRFGTSFYFMTGEDAAAPPPEPNAADTILALLSVVPYVIFCVAWHRLLLMGPVHGLPSWHPTWKTRHWLFLVYMFVLGLIVGGVAVLLMLLIAVFGSIFSGADPEGDAAGPLVLLLLLGIFLLLGWLMARLSFVLPARALDERYGLRDSWRQTRGQGLRILAVFVIVQLIILLPSVFVFFFLAASGGAMGAINEMADGYSTEALILVIGLLPMILFGLLATYLSTALGVTVLSLAFKTCSGWSPDAPDQAPPDASLSA